MILILRVLLFSNLFCTSAHATQQSTVSEGIGATSGKQVEEEVASVVLLQTDTLMASRLTTSEAKPPTLLQQGETNNINGTVGSPFRTIVLYAWFETPEEIDNLKFFVEHAMSKDSHLIDFIFIDSTPGGSKYIPKDRKNVRVIARQNEGFYLRSWVSALNKIKKDDYKYFVLMNGRVRGPYLDRFPQAAIRAAAGSFVYPFTRLLQNNVHLAGTTVNCMCQGSPCDTSLLHLQSNFLVADRIGIGIIHSTLDRPFASREDAKYLGEIPITQNLLKAGSGIAAMQKYWRDNDFEKPKETRSRCEQFAEITEGEKMGDPMYPFNDVNPISLSKTSVDPEDVVMFDTIQMELPKRIYKVQR